MIQNLRKRCARLFLWLYYVRLSLRYVHHIGLFDSVWYRGRKYNVINGAVSGRWTLNIDGKNVDVPRCECRKVKSISNYVHTFKTRYRWLMNSWWDIDWRKLSEMVCTSERSKGRKR